MKNIKEKVSKWPSWTFTFIVLIIILWLTLAPHPLGETDIPMFPGADKIVHALMFGGLAMAGFFDWSRTHKWAKLPVMWGWCIVLASAVIGIDIEFAQQSMHLGRSLEIGDMIADVAGAVLALIVWRIMDRSRPGSVS
ncbi:MAG: VanZ family protein [Muribaculaceae bacterium]|nr:VanZ family protein [Muribaculaceae bacterium]